MQDYTKFRVFTILIAILLAVALIATVRLVSVLLERSAADRGYRDLRQFAPDDYYAEQVIESGPGQLIHGVTLDVSVNDDNEEDDDEDDEEEQVPPPGIILEPGADLIDINSHYAGWIKIPETRVDYPMVQFDNTRYLNTTFWGTHNGAGTLFLDERNPLQFNGSFTIIYGHNSRTGGMFGSLNRYTSADYMLRHPDITINTRDGEVLTYSVIAAFQTTIYDNLFTLFDADEGLIREYFTNHGAPSYSINYLALSTCVTSNSDDDRFLVLAAR